MARRRVGETDAPVVIWALLALVLAGPPKAALQYECLHLAQAQSTWHLTPSPPMAVLGGQIEQESSWRPTARSAYAEGLAQFTPDTALWIGQLEPSLKPPQPLDPAWALKAQGVYVAWLWERAPGRQELDTWGFVLSAYNGGKGWWSRDRRLAAAAGADPDSWFENVERYSTRAPWAMKENRDYVRRVLFDRAPKYLMWGTGCDGA